MITAQRLCEIEEELLKLQLELQEYISVNPLVQSVTNNYQNSTVSSLQRARHNLNALVHNVQQYPKVS